VVQVDDVRNKAVQEHRDVQHDLGYEWSLLILVGAVALSEVSTGVDHSARAFPQRASRLLACRRSAKLYASSRSLRS
jgi:hypothetical protein